MRLLFLLLFLGSPALAQGSFANLLEELFVPSRSLVERYQSLSQHLQGKFPFSVAAALQSHTPRIAEAADPASINAPVAGWAIDMSYFAPISELIRTGMRVLLFFILFWLLIDRLTPQLRL